MQEQILKLHEVIHTTKQSSSSIYRGAANGTFPKPIKLGERSSGWIASEVDQWLEDRIEASRNTEV